MIPPPRAGARGGDGEAILLADPSLFTAPYDARLAEGLTAAGIDAWWATRGLRPGEEAELDPARCLPFFYRWSDGPRRRSGSLARLVKGVEHALGLRKLVRLATGERFALVHFQWLLVPALDGVAIRRIRRRKPVVITVHDTEPFNGKAVGRAQRGGFDHALAQADRLIVHTAAGREVLSSRGLDAGRIAVVPHGRLDRTATSREPGVEDRAGRWTIVQFGKMQHYKGVDLLIEALGRLPSEARAALRVVVAGEPLIDLAPLRARAAELGLSSDTLELRPGYLSAGEVEALVQEADAFVFPYRAIEASGVLLLVAGAGKWIVASRLGAFVDLIGEGGDAGELVAPEDVGALAAALVRSVGQVPRRSPADAIPDWAAIGRMTAEVYRDAARAWQADRDAAGTA